MGAGSDTPDGWYGDAGLQAMKVLIDCWQAPEEKKTGINPG